MFQAKLRGWRRLAAGLVLVPGLTGLGADALGLLGRAAGQDRTAPAGGSDESRAAMRQAREAYDAKDYSKSKELAEKARALRAPAAFYEEAPDDLLADLSKKPGMKSASTKPATTDSKALMGMAKQAMDAGDLNRAQDLATQAVANQGNTRWGLFDDTPSSLLKDIQQAKSRRDRDQSERLLTESRTLLDRKAATKAERATNLTAAEDKARLAARLHGPYSMWDFSDRPEDLIADARKARSAEKLPATRVAPARDPKMMAAAPKAGRKMPSADDGMEPVRPAADATAMKKAAALMQEAAALKQGGHYADARKKLTDACRLNAKFGRDDDTPESHLSQLNIDAQRKIHGLCGEAKTCAARKDAVTANAKLDEAHQIAMAMGLDAAGVMEIRVSLKPAKPDEVATGVLPPALPPVPSETEAPLVVTPPPLIETVGGTDMTPIVALPPKPAAPPTGLLPDLDAPPIKVTPPIVAPITKVLPPEPAPITKIVPPEPAPRVNIAPEPEPAPITKIVPPAVVAPDVGLELLKKARLEVREKNYEAARKIAVDVINGPYACKADAEALLTTIETHEAEGRKQMARRAFENGLAAFSASNYAQALAVFKQIDPMQLPATSRAEMKDKTVEAVTKLKAEDDLKAALANGGTVKPSPRSPAAELPNPAPRGGADNLVKQQEALSQVEFQKLRSEALKLESDATARFGRGETDAALGDMDKFVAKVKATTLEPNKQAMLVRPIEARMDRLRIVKHQTDFLTKESRDRRNFNSSMTQEAMYREKKHEEVTALLKQANKLNEEAKYREAMVCLEEAKTMDPDDPSINGTLQMTKLMFRKKEFKRVSDSQEKWIWETGNEWKDIPAVSGRMPLLVDDDKDHREQVRLRSRDAGGNVPRSRNEKEKEIERKMSTPVNLNFKGMPLTDVVDHMASYTNINFDLDLRGLKEGNVDPSMPITANLTTAVSLKSALNIICQQAGLKHVIENEAIRITTAKNATGRQQVKTLSVGDLVIPAMNATPKPVYDLASQLELASGIGQNRMSSNPSPRLPGNGLNGGSGVGSGSNATMASGSGRLLNTPMDGGVKSNSINHNGTLERELIHLLTTTIKPDSWREMGGDGTIEYFPLTLALVINQSPEVIEEVERLLESLRKLQDLEVSIEVKVVSLAETFYERIGVDFAMGIKTNAKALNGSISGVNNRNFSGNVVGLAVPGVPTPDLDIPIRATSFAKAIPPFGGFTNSFADGGLSLGLAFLSDIQVQMFLEAAQGDTRTNVMQAPKLTALNGTSAAMTVGDVQFFLTGITVSSVNGQLVFTPQNQPFSVGLTQPAQQQQGQGGVAPLQNTVPGLGLFIQPVVSADRRFVRLNIQQSFTSLVSGSQQIPLTTIITPAFENGGQGQPIPFTQFLQQPRFSNLETQTVVVVPDGGTVVMGGLKYMTEGRNEFGPPVLSKIPYLNRLFKNVAYGREGRSILIMVTPRIIINREEQEKQTGVRDDDVAGGLTGQ